MFGRILLVLLCLVMTFRIVFIIRQTEILNWIFDMHEWAIVNCDYRDKKKVDRNAIQRTKEIMNLTSNNVSIECKIFH